MNKTIEEILSDPEIGPVVKSFVDKRVTQGVQTALSKRLDTSTLTARLYRLEEAAKDQETKNNIRFYAYKKAAEAGVDYSLIETEVFSDEAAAEKRVNALAAFAKKRQTEELNQQVADASFKPQGGLVREQQPEKTFDDYVKEIERNGL